MNKWSELSVGDQRPMIKYNNRNEKNKTKKNKTKQNKKTKTGQIGTGKKLHAQLSLFRLDPINISRNSKCFTENIGTSQDLQTRGSNLNFDSSWPNWCVIWNILSIKVFSANALRGKQQTKQNKTKPQKRKKKW